MIHGSTLFLVVQQVKAPDKVMTYITLSCYDFVYYPRFVDIVRISLISTFRGYYPHFMDISAFCGYYLYFVDISDIFAFRGYYLY